ncbi:MAG: glycosyltransferase [Prevotella sp.]|nr:glycosyltransferase [Prevotella sp.]
MNILFFTTFKVSPTKGGTERISISVANGLKNIYGCHCYSSYGIEAETPKEDCFDEEFYVGGKNIIPKLADIIRVKSIDVVLDQGEFTIVRPLSEAIDNKRCKIVMGHHFQPGWELNFGRFDSYLNNFLKAPDILRAGKRFCRMILYPFYRYKDINALPHKYHEAYEYADAIVLLSKGFKHGFMEFGNITDDNKFFFIPNSLSFSDFLPKSEIVNKKHDVLIVSRMDETQKRISLAIKIWQQVKSHPEAKSWTLNIIGHGTSLTAYKKMVKKLDIPDIQFLGRQIPNEYYKESSIFLMTSKSEGWGLTLTESQQNGCVPLAFNSYESLQDIIEDGTDGFIIPEGDINGYVDKLLWLMSHDEERKQIAGRCIDRSHRFENKKVVAMWYNLFSKLTEKG